MIIHQLPGNAVGAPAIAGPSVTPTSPECGERSKQRMMHREITTWHEAVGAMTFLVPGLQGAFLAGRALPGDRAHIHTLGAVGPAYAPGALLGARGRAARRPKPCGALLLHVAAPG